jgi:hypothetical protein
MMEFFTERADYLRMPGRRGTIILRWRWFMVEMFAVTADGGFLCCGLTVGPVRVGWEVGFR